MPRAGGGQQPAPYDSVAVASTSDIWQQPFFPTGRYFRLFISTRARTSTRCGEALAAYLTDDFPQSRWTDQEVGAAVVRDLLVLPLRVDIDPYGFIGRIQAMPARGIDAHVLADRIATALRAHPSTRATMAEVTVGRFVKSYSYDDARANYQRIQQLPADAWTPELAASVRHALVENDQLSEAYIGRGQPLPAAAVALLESLSL